MRIINGGESNCGKELDVRKYENELAISITQEDENGDYSSTLSMTITEEQAFRLCNYILRNL